MLHYVKVILMLGNGVVFLGADGCGKSQLFRRFVAGNFEEAHRREVIYPKGFDLWIDAIKFFWLEEFSGLNGSEDFSAFSFADPQAQASLQSASILLMCVDVSSEAAIARSLAYYQDAQLGRMGLSGALQDGELSRIIVFTKVDLNPTFNPGAVLSRLAAVGVIPSSSDAYFSTSARTRQGLSGLVAYAEACFSIDRLCEVEPDTDIESRIHVNEIDYRKLGAVALDVPVELRELTEEESDAYEDENIQSKSYCARLLSCWCNLFASCFGSRADCDSESETPSSDSVAKP